jgi:hypothetical protein
MIWSYDQLQGGNIKINKYKIVTTDLFLSSGEGREKPIQLVPLERANLNHCIHLRMDADPISETLFYSI